MVAGACLKSLSSVIIMQDFVLTTITATEKCTLILNSTSNFDKVSGASKVGQVHRVIVHG